ncbi:hypothetical protein BDW74DRAFT_165777 [Aspergillus multicolor]|uniref:putative MFS transporter n=1 Tax=Aspergillus multicolor TaxID=41759 RepID=UPI003CCE3E8A
MPPPFNATMIDSTLIVPQPAEWSNSVDKSATSMNYGMFLQGVGGLMTIPLIEAFGRLPVWLWPQIITTFMVLGAALSTIYDAFTAFRCLRGLFDTVPQVVGLPIIHDMYDPEVDAMNRSTTFLIGPFLGPAIAGYIGAGSDWVLSFGILTVLYGLSTIFIFPFGHGTYFAPGRECQRNTRLQAIFGNKSHDLPVLRMITLWTKTLLVGMTVKVSTFIAQPPYIFDTVASASLRWAPITSGLLPFGWGMVVVGMIPSTEYPKQATVVCTASGFSAGYFHPAWIARDGVAAVFGTQAGVVLGVLMSTITPVIIVLPYEPMQFCLQLAANHCLDHSS